MKKNFTAVALAILGLYLAGCGTSGTVEDNFGYNRPDYKVEPVRTEKKVAVVNKNASEENWENPLAADNAGNDENNNVSWVASSQNVVYVPVIVPWWYDYYGWMSYPSYRYRHSGIYIGFGYNFWNDWYSPYYDWYSPWYSYDPYWGYNWHHRPHWGYHDWYYHDSYYHNHHGYSYEPDRVKNRTDRNFGSRRSGVYNTNSSESSYTNVGASRMTGSSRTGSGSTKSIYQDRNVPTYDYSGSRNSNRNNVVNPTDSRGTSKSVYDNKENSGSRNYVSPDYSPSGSRTNTDVDKSTRGSSDDSYRSSGSTSRSTSGTSGSSGNSGSSRSSSGSTYKPDNSSTSKTSGTSSSSSSSSRTTTSSPSSSSTKSSGTSSSGSSSRSSGSSGSSGSSSSRSSGGRR